MRIAGATQALSFDASITLESEERLSGTARSTLRHADLGLTIPDVPFVSSVNEEVRLEIDFVAVAAAGEDQASASGMSGAQFAVQQEQARPVVADELQVLHGGVDEGLFLDLFVHEPLQEAETGRVILLPGQRDQVMDELGDVLLMFQGVLEGSQRRVPTRWVAAPGGAGARGRCAR